MVQQDLACIRCGYNLRGLDPSEVCPECGFEVRRSLLFVIDPSRNKVALLRRPRFLGLSLVLLVLFLFCAAAILWVAPILYLIDQLRESANPIFFRWPTWNPAYSGGFVLLAVCLTAMFNRPTDEQPLVSYTHGLSLMRIGLLGWGGLLLVLGLYDHLQYTNLTNTRLVSMIKPLFLPDQLDLWRSVLRLGLDMSIIMIILGFRPIINFLGRRCVYHRVVQISRQGFHAMLVAVSIAGIGDLVRIFMGIVTRFGWLSDSKETILLVSSTFIIVGSGMLTLALSNALWDAVRLHREMVRPVYSMDELVTPDALGRSNGE